MANSGQATITIVGNIGSDPKLDFVGDRSTPVLKLRVAVNVRRGREDVVNWYDAAIWGKRGEALSSIVSKGERVAVAGSLVMRAYTSRGGEPKAAGEIRVTEITLCGGGKREDSDDDIPF